VSHVLQKGCGLLTGRSHLLTPYFTD
jgi:hypothetical protein